MPPPSDISVHFDEDAPPISCRSVAEMDAALDDLHAERLRSAGSGPPLAVSIVIPGYEIDTGLGADESYVCVQVEPCDGEYYLAVGDEAGDDEAADGEGRMFYGAGQDSYWAPKNLIPLLDERQSHHLARSHLPRVRDIATRGPGCVDQRDRPDRADWKTIRGLLR